MKRFLAISIFLIACHRKPENLPPGPPPVASAPVLVEPRVAIADLHSAFWTHDGTLVGVSATRIYAVAPDTCAASASAAVVGVTSVVARNGTDTFVVRGRDSDLRSAKGLATIATLAHVSPLTKGAVAPSGARVALSGCTEHPSDRNSSPSCGVLYDGATGARTAGFSTTHSLERLDFSDDGTYLVGRSDDAGLTVFDAATGKPIVTRPRWKKLLEVHAWNGSDLAEISGDALVVGYDEWIEHVDLTTGKSLGKLPASGKTMAAFGPKTGRVAVLSGAADRVTVWDSQKHAVVRKFELKKSIQPGADCTHCALEFDDADEDRIWLTSAYTDDRLELYVGSGGVERASAHELRGESVPSATQRLMKSHDSTTKETKCAIVSRTVATELRSIPAVFCNVLDARDNRWPYPGFSPDGRYLAALSEGALHVMPTTTGAGCVATR